MNHKVVDGRENDLSERNKLMTCVVNQGKSLDKIHKEIGVRVDRGRTDAENTDKSIIDKEVVNLWNNDDRKKLSFDKQCANKHNQ